MRAQRAIGYVRNIGATSRVRVGRPVKLKVLCYNQLLDMQRLLRSAKHIHTDGRGSLGTEPVY
jgi:hypothetical protein